ARVASFGLFGADNVHLSGLAHVFFLKQAARIHDTERLHAMLVGCRRNIIQSDFMDFLFYSMRDIPMPAIPAAPKIKITTRNISRTLTSVLPDLEGAAA